MAPLLPLETFRELLGFNPWHFWGLTNSTVPVTSAANGLLREYPWQDVDAFGRADIRSAIERAEEKLREQLHFAVAPRYASQVLDFPRPANQRLGYSSSVDRDGRWLSVQLEDEGYVQALGIESLTLIGTPAVTYSDPDGDGLNEKFTITQATTVTDASQIAVYFAAADRLNGESAGEHWRIQPVSVSISGGTATITGPAWLLVKPIKYEGVTNIGSGLNPATSANFVTALDVYERTTSANGTTTATSQGVLTWETPATGCCGSITDSSSDPAAIAQAIARVGLRNARLGIVAPGEATYDTSTGLWSAVNWGMCTPPDRVTVRYLAGYPLDTNGQMDARWREITAYLAAAEMPRPQRAADSSNRWLAYWQFDQARSAGAGDEAYGAISQEDLSNPLGTRRGQVEAWRRIKHLYHARGFLPG